LSGYGYLTVMVNAKQIIFKFNEVNINGSKQPYDKVIIVNLNNNQIVQG